MALQPPLVRETRLKWRQLAKQLVRDNDGAALAEAILITPVVLFLLVGILEFGAVLYNKIQVETGLRDAARYMARCQDYWNLLNPPSVTPPTFGCSEDSALDIAVSGPPGDTRPLVPGWAVSDVTVTQLLRDGTWVVRVETEFNYPGGPLLGLIGLPLVRMAARHDERVIGW